MTAHTLPTGSQERKDIPLVRGLLDYFPAALAAVAEVSRAGNEKHNPGEEMHHARGKSMDHADCILRHLVDRGTIDPEDNLRHSAKTAWRALALLQEELEAAGAPLPRGARLPESKTPILDWARENPEEAKRMLDEAPVLRPDSNGGCLPGGWGIGSVQYVCGYDGDTKAGYYKIVACRLPRKGDLYVWLDPSSDSGRPNVQTAGCDHSDGPNDGPLPIVEPVEDPEVFADPSGVRYRRLEKRDVRRGDCFLTLPNGHVSRPSNVDLGIQRVIVERV
jgi:hypothetical protein